MDDLTGEFICLRCSLAACDETSPKCLYRMESRVILKATKATYLRRAIRAMERKLNELEGKNPRAAYFRLNYLRNRNSKLNAANERNRQKREAKI